MSCKFILAENWQDSAHVNVLKDNESSATGNQLVAVTGAKMVILELLQKLWVVLESEGQGRELNQSAVSGFPATWGQATGWNAFDLRNS